MDLKRKIMAWRRSIDLLEMKKMGVRYIMKDSHEVWMCKKMMGIHNVMKDYHEVWI